MGKDRYNPYNSRQYFNLPRPAPEYEASHILSPRSGMSLNQVYELRRMKERAEEIGHMEYYRSLDQRLHRNPWNALDAGRLADQIMGHPPCEGSGGN